MVRANQVVANGWRLFVATLLAPLFIVVWPRIAQATDFYIADDDVAGLIAAINTANSNTTADTIHLTKGSTYTLLTPDPLGGAVGPTGLPAITSRITIQGNGAVVQRNPGDETVAPGQPPIPAFRILYVAPGGDLTLHNLALYHGQAVGDTPRSAQDGGAIFVSPNAKVTLDNCELAHNRAAFLGGGILNDGQLQIKQGRITQNQAVDGGGIFNGFNGDLSIEGAAITANEAEFGGGLFNDNGGLAQIRYASVFGNRANRWGGGIASAGFGGGSDAGTVLTVIGSNISANTGETGGGIFRNIGRAELTHSRIVANQASGDGGGIYQAATDGLFTLVNSTVAENVAGGRGGGVFAANTFKIDFSTLAHNQAASGSNLFSEATAVTLRNSIVANPASSDNCTGALASDGYNVASDASCSLTLSGDLPNIEPLLEPALFQQAYALLPGSPAIDHTPVGTNGCGTTITNDQRGFPRPQGNGCDVGAYETQPILLISASNSGKVGDLRFKDEDILAYDPVAATWSLYFDGSDVGIKYDVDALQVMDDGSLLFSLNHGQNLPGVGQVDDSDIIRFIPTLLGTQTAGSFAWWFDGSDVGLTSESEDLDAFTVAADGRLIISTVGSFRVPGVEGRDEDLLIFSHTSLGEQTAGVWSLYFDGSDVGFERDSEDLWGVTLNRASGALYLSTAGKFSIPGLTGDGNDIFICQPLGLGADTQCTFQPYWDGDLVGFDGKVIDAFAPAIEAELPTSVVAAQREAAEAAAVDELDDTAADDVPEDAPEDEGEASIFLPLIER